MNGVVVKRELICIIYTNIHLYIDDESNFGIPTFLILSFFFRKNPSSLILNKRSPYFSETYILYTKNKISRTDSHFCLFSRGLLYISRFVECSQESSLPRLFNYADKILRVISTFDLIIEFPFSFPLFYSASSRAKSMGLSHSAPERFTSPLICCEA